MKNAKKKMVCQEIDQHSNTIIGFGEDIFANPELGFREVRTAGIVKKVMKEIGLFHMTTVGKTGVKAWLKDKSTGPAIAIIGEMDAVISPEHPCANPATGAAHSCGHHAQIANLIGAMYGLTKIRDTLEGNVCFMAVPAEEFIEIEYRLGLRDAGEIAFLGGKQQLIYEGAFDDIDMAMMVHSETARNDTHIVIHGTASGFIGKTIRFIGKEAHAGGEPWLGTNALNAASLALQAIHAQRETFPDQDKVRVHPIITKGGDLVNTVPADVRMESYVRAATISAMQSANSKVDRAIQGASYAIGTTVDILTLPGYLPMEQNRTMGELFAENAAKIYPEALIEKDLPFKGSTDMGDLSAVLPIIQPTISGFGGTAHGKDFCVLHPDLAYIGPGKIMSMTVIDLLAENAAIAHKIIEDFTYKNSAEYVELWQQILTEEASYHACY